MKPQEIRNGLLAKKLISNLERRNFEAYYCQTNDEAIKKALEIIPKGSTISWGGSMTIRDMGLTTALHNDNYNILDRDLAKDHEEAEAIYRKAFYADFYLSSANAITEGGEIVNIDGRGNRVAAITFGPKKVLFIIGMNKVTRDLDSAIARARGTAAPINTARLGSDTPCRIDGICHNCNSENCICNYIHILRNSFPKHHHAVILVGEDLGY